jgi:hypothetical protein
MSCVVRECKQGAIGGYERGSEITNKKRKEENNTYRVCLTNIVRARVEQWQRSIECRLAPHHHRVLFDQVSGI